MRYAELLPSTTYLSPGFEYLTDTAAMPARVRGALRVVAPGDRVRHSTVQRDVGRSGDGVDDRYHGGHIVAVSLGGYASGPNLFPQAGNFNQGAFARLEHSWRHALQEGCTVEVDIALAEGDDPATPSFLIVTHWEDGTEETLTFINEGHML
ncbi:MAG: DNA/RNA non-specific endonuclease [Acidimicrobiia bacterium]|nr:DNA/RNA non-specific endonuclease [Acidimicrobiia bacterium]